MEKSKIEGVYAGVLCWWVDKDITKWISIQQLELLKQHGNKSYRYDWEESSITIQGKKKRVFFDYDMNTFFKEVQR